MNYFVQQVKPDGLTLTLGSGSQLDPGNYRIPQSHYDPATFLMVGGVDLGGAVLIARVDALPRLTNKSMAPLVMGSPSGMPHNTMLPVAWGIEYLGWNARWVSGYPSPTAALALAIERGETDLTAFNTSGFTGGLLDKSKFKVLYQTGSNRCSAPSSLPAVQGVPLFVDAMRGKIADPVAQKAFEYWCNSSSIGTWIALPPGTPQPIVDVYRESYRKAAADPAFLKQGKNVSDDISVVTYDSLTSTARFNGSVSTDVMEVIPNLLRKQGLVVN
jgi:hypothetical protein